LAGILALLFLVGPPTKDPASPPIPIRLVAAVPSPIEVSPKPTLLPKPQTETLAPSQLNTASQPEPVPDLFRVIPPNHTSPRTEREKATTPPSPSLVQMAMNALTSPKVTHLLSRGSRPNSQTGPPSRILLDHKAGDFLTDSTPPKILYKPVPHYPKIARELGLEGKTLLRVEILQDGRLGAIKVRESCGHKVLDEAATKAIKHWKFAPAHDGQFTVRSVVDLPIRFSLRSMG